MYGLIGLRVETGCKCCGEGVLGAGDAGSLADVELNGEPEGVGLGGELNHYGGVVVTWWWWRHDGD